jgi:hypothetical protein
MFKNAGRLVAKLGDWLQSTEIGGLDVEIGDLAKALSCHCMVRIRTYVTLKLLHEKD